MNKAFVITRAFDKLTDVEKLALNTTNEFKIAVNYANVFNPNYRLFHDNHHYKWYSDKFPNDKFLTPKIAQKLIEKNGYEKHFSMFYECCYKPNSKNPNELYVWSGSIIPSIDYCIKLGYDHILLIADNTVHNKIFQKNISFAVDKLKEHASIYQFSNGKFNLPIKSIQEFFEMKY